MSHSVDDRKVIRSVGGRAARCARNAKMYAVLTEFFDRSDEASGDSWLILTSTSDDPTYLTQPFMTSTHFKKEPNSSKWNPRACEVTLPVEGK